MQNVTAATDNTDRIASIIDPIIGDGTTVWAAEGRQGTLLIFTVCRTGRESSADMLTRGRPILREMAAALKGAGYKVKTVRGWMNVADRMRYQIVAA